MKGKGQAEKPVPFLVEPCAANLLRGCRTVITVPLALEVVDDLADGCELFGVLFRDCRAEFLFKSHDELDRVKRIRAQIVNERRFKRHLLGVDAKLLNDNLS